jgi:hypothetical protein
VISVQHQDAGGLARRVVLTGDKSATFALEQFALTVDSPRLVASIRRADDPPGTQLTEVTVQPGRSAALIADVEAGTSDVEVTWNFDADNTGSYPAPAGMGGPPGGFPGGMPGGFPGGMPLVPADHLPEWVALPAVSRAECLVVSKAECLLV